MNLFRIYKAIDEGLKLSLIDFGSNKILKSSYIDNGSITKQDIDEWYESGEDMPEDMYKELCKDQYIGFYKVEDDYLLNDIFSRILFENVNLNWIKVLSYKYYRFFNKNYKFKLDISHWNINRILDKTFNGCTALTAIKIPDSITYIEDHAFKSCFSLISINIPDGVISIGNEAFKDCLSLTSIKIPNRVTSIGNEAFYECESLSSINIPNSITYINDNTFRDCISLTSIEIPDGVTSIGEKAFCGCESLSSIKIPISVKEFRLHIFDGCYLLASIQYNGTKKQWIELSQGLIFYCGPNCIVHCLDGDLKINQYK